VAALLPDGFLNKNRLLYGPTEFGRIHDEYDDLLDVPELSVPGHSRRICKLFFTPDGKSLVSGGMDNVVKVWDPRDWTERYCYDMPRAGVNLSIDLAPNGATLAFNDATVIHLVDLQTGNFIGKLEGHTWVVRSLRFLPGGTQLASEDSDGVRLWDVGTGEELGIEPGKRVPGFSAVESWKKRLSQSITSSEGRTQVSVSEIRRNDQAVEILDLTSHKTLKRFVTKGIEEIALPPNGRCIVTGHCDGRFAVWQMPDR
jgi:WD40 repeat protein